MPGGGLFLAYTRDDGHRVEQVARWLEDAGLRPWSDVELEAGVDWELAIADRLRDSDAVVVFVSPAAEHASWVQREIDYAKASGTPIVPLLIEGDPSPRLANIQHVDLRGATSLPAGLVETLRRLIAREDTERLSSAATEVLKALDNRVMGRVLYEIQGVLVLLLGNFSGDNLDRLLRLQAELQRRRLHPVIFDFERSPSSDYGETVRLLAGLAGFVIADMSDPRSVVMELQLIAPDLAVPIVPIIAANQEPVALFADLLGKYDWVLPPLRYQDLEDLVAALEIQVIGRARTKRRDLGDRKAATALAQVVDAEPRPSADRG
jgi:hypothetical protein